MKRLASFLIAMMAFSLVACTSSNNFAPVSNGWSDTKAASQTYRVQPDDTLYSIAFRFGVDYQKLASINHIDAPYSIAAGQNLKLLPGADDTSTSPQQVPVQTGSAPATVVTSQPAMNAPQPKSQPSVTSQPDVQQPPQSNFVVDPNSKWQWPAQGKIIHTFSDNYGGIKGVDITGKMGDPVRATAAGKIVYEGSGLKGYGLLIIIKHSPEYLSAYAHNSQILVKEGESVKAGQQIALMGNSDASQVMLHFEIRQSGKPIDPLKFLPSK